jgi:hypothetical protein
MSRGQSAPNVLCPPEPSEAGRRPIDVNRKRWAAAAAVAAVLVLLLCVAVAVNRSGTAGPSSPPARQAFGFDAAYADRDPLVLVVRYGDSSSCPSKAVARSVLQESDRVVVTLTRTPRDTNQICTSNYAAKLVRIHLSAPLGSRTVIDGSRQKPVPISPGNPPFG